MQESKPTYAGIPHGICALVAGKQRSTSGAISCLMNEGEYPTALNMFLRGYLTGVWLPIRTIDEG